jgi:DNA modification methylase
MQLNPVPASSLYFLLTNVIFQRKSTLVFFLNAKAVIFSAGSSGVFGVGRMNGFKNVGTITVTMEKPIEEFVNKVVCGDCLKVMKTMSAESVDLIITDPPFNIGKKYNSYNDNLKKEEYLDWCKEWLKGCIRLLKPSGSLYVFNYPENNAYLLPFLDKHLVFKRWMTWHYPTNTGVSPTNYTRTQHSILFYTKTQGAIFNKDAIAEPYKNPTDKRIKELIANGKKGRTPYDVFQFNIVKNVSKEKTEHVCQLPEKLVEIFVKASSKEGDFIFDPFMGSGTVAAVAKKAGRKYSGCEIDPKYCEIINNRLKNVRTPV